MKKVAVGEVAKGQIVHVTLRNYVEVFQLKVVKKKKLIAELEDKDGLTWILDIDDIVYI